MELVKVGMKESLSDKLAAAWSDSAKTVIAKRRNGQSAIKGRYTVFLWDLGTARYLSFGYPNLGLDLDLLGYWYF